MKRAKGEQIKNAVTQYMRRRHYLETEIHGRRTLSTCLGEMSVRKRSRISAGVENVIACSSISGDFNSCDQQFARLKKFVLESSPSQNEELSTLLFPVFVHMYCDLLGAGTKTSAHKFHERHTEVFHAEKQKDFVRSLRKLESKADLQSAKDLTDFREHRYTVRLSHSSITHLLTHLKVGDNMIVLQIVNRHINIVGTDTHGRALDLHSNPPNPPSSKINSSKHSSRDKEEKDPTSASASSTSSSSSSSTKKESSKEKDEGQSTLRGDRVEEEGRSMLVSEGEEGRRLREVGEKLESLPPTSPSVVFYTVINASAHQGLCTTTVSPDCHLLSGGFEDSSIAVYRLQPLPLPYTPSDCHNERLTLAADYIVKDQDEREATIDTDRDESIARLRAHNGPVYKTQFTPDSKYLLSCSRDATVRLWSLASRTNAALYRGHSAPVWDMDYCAFTNHFATSSRDQTVKLWSLDRVCPLRSFVGHDQDIQAVAIHPNGNYIASGSADKTVRLWDIQEGKCLRTMCGHRGSILSLAFSPNGLMLASAGDDRRIHIWDLNSGTVRKELRGHSDTVYSLAFSPCSELLASGGQDCTLRLWDVRSNPGHDRTASTQVEGHTSPELMGVFSTKSSTITSLSFPRWHLLHCVGTHQ